MSSGCIAESPVKLETSVLKSCEIVSAKDPVWKHRNMTLFTEVREKVQEKIYERINIIRIG
jgi:hypothetical protein